MNLHDLLFLGFKRHRYERISSSANVDESFMMNHLSKYKDGLWTDTPEDIARDIIIVAGALRGKINLLERQVEELSGIAEKKRARQERKEQREKEKGKRGKKKERKSGKRGRKPGKRGRKPKSL